MPATTPTIDLDFVVSDMEPTPCTGFSLKFANCQNEALWLAIKPYCDHHAPKCETCKGRMVNNTGKMNCGFCLADVKQPYYREQVRWERLNRG